MFAPTKGAHISASSARTFCSSRRRKIKRRGERRAFSGVGLVIVAVAVATAAVAKTFQMPATFHVDATGASQATPSRRCQPFSWLVPSASPVCGISFSTSVASSCALFHYFFISSNLAYTSNLHYIFLHLLCTIFVPIRSFFHSISSLFQFFTVPFFFFLNVDLFAPPSGPLAMPLSRRGKPSRGRTSPAARARGARRSSTSSSRSRTTLAPCSSSDRRGHSPSRRMHPSRREGSHEITLAHPAPKSKARSTIIPQSKEKKSANRF